MTNTKFRKRALLSSVAMLLVALVALGSATFAWFSTTNTATASQMSAKTAKSSNLLLRETFEAGTTWVQNLSFAASTANVSTPLTPVTTANFSTWQTAQADSYDAVVAGSGDHALKSASKSTTYMAYTTVYAKYGEVPAQGETAETRNLVVSLTGLPQDANADYLRVALVPMAIAGDVTGKSMNTNAVYGTAKDDYALDLTNASKTAPASDSSSIVTTISASNIPLGSIEQGKVYGFDVYVYFEGTDIHCMDSKSGALASGITFNFAANPQS